MPEKSLGKLLLVGHYYTCHSLGKFEMCVLLKESHDQTGICIISVNNIMITLCDVLLLSHLLTVAQHPIYIQ